MNLLIVDPNPAERRESRRLLEDSCSVREAETGREGLAQIAHDTDCVLVESRLPDMSGIDFLVQLRAQNMTVPAMLYGRDGGADLLARAREAGADDVQSKDIAGDALLRSIRAAVNRRALESSLRVSPTELGGKKYWR